jgi:hypothetical protein
MKMYTNQSITLRSQHDMPYDLRPRALPLQWDEVMDSDSNSMSPTMSSDLRFAPVHMTAQQELFLLSPQATAYQDSPGEIGGHYADMNATSNVPSPLPSTV